MKKLLTQEIEIPEGVTVTIVENLLTVKGSEGENSREFEVNGSEFKVKEGKIILSNKKATKREKKLMNTITAHIKNMIKGVTEKFEYKLKVVFNHFPITLEVKGNKVTIKNFLGEKIPRYAEILNGTEVKINGQEITVTSVNKELAGQTAANFESATKITNKDRRVFQDGIFITHKAGREI